MKKFPLRWKIFLQAYADWSFPPSLDTKELVQWIIFLNGMIGVWQQTEN